MFFGICTLGNDYSQETLWLQACEGCLIVMEAAFFGQEVEKYNEDYFPYKAPKISRAFSLFMLRYTRGIIVGVFTLCFHLL